MYLSQSKFGVGRVARAGVDDWSHFLGETSRTSECFNLISNVGNAEWTGNSDCRGFF